MADEEKTTISVDSGFRVQVWRSGAGLHILGETGDGKGGWTTSSILTCPAEKGQELAQAILKAIGAG